MPSLHGVVALGVSDIAEMCGPLSPYRYGTEVSVEVHGGALGLSPGGREAGLDPARSSYTSYAVVQPLC